jgi:hypothetical protein
MCRWTVEKIVSNTFLHFLLKFILKMECVDVDWIHL